MTEISRQYRVISEGMNAADYAGVEKKLDRLEEFNILTVHVGVVPQIR